MKIEPYYTDNHVKIFNKDCQSMNELPDSSVQMVCCSPPYWGLRKYSGEQELIWGGDGHCEHSFDTPTMATLGFNTLFRPGGETSTPLGLPSDKGKYAETVKGGADRQRKEQVGNFCSLCGAWKGAYGLEPNPEMYIEHSIEILKEIRRVLRKDGVVFWNIGDSYATHASGSKKTGHNFRSAEVAAEQGIGTIKRLYGKKIGLKEKDLCLIPFRLAIACQEDGWWVRSVIIWSKPNPMPESVTDRPTESHEYILMLTKSAKYYYDQDAVRRPYSDATLPRMMRGVGYHKYVGVPEAAGGGAGNQPRENIRKDFEAWQYNGQDTKNYGLAGAQSPSDTKRRIIESIKKQEAGANLRSVWEFPTQPYPEAHFAVFPEKLPEICIKAATPEVGCCSKCGSPWERVIDKPFKGTNINKRKDNVHLSGSLARCPSDGWEYEGKTLGWQPTCKCNADKVPSLVLDPFLGAGTVAWVAKKLNRRCVGYEISEEYCRLAVERCRQQALGLTKDAQM